MLVTDELALVQREDEVVACRLGAEPIRCGTLAESRTLDDATGFEAFAHAELGPIDDRGRTRGMNVEVVDDGVRVSSTGPTRSDDPSSMPPPRDPPRRTPSWTPLVLDDAVAAAEALAECDDMSVFGRAIAGGAAFFVLPEETPDEMVGRFSMRTAGDVWVSESIELGYYAAFAGAVDVTPLDPRARAVVVVTSISGSSLDSGRFLYVLVPGAAGALRVHSIEIGWTGGEGGHDDRYDSYVVAIEACHYQTRISARGISLVDASGYSATHIRSARRWIDRRPIPDCAPDRFFAFDPRGGFTEPEAADDIAE
jgi:hypothetical protein